MNAALVLLLAAALVADPMLRRRGEPVTSARHEFVIRMGGTMDDENARAPVSYTAWSREFEAMREVRISNIATPSWLLADGPPWLRLDGATGGFSGARPASAAGQQARVELKCAIAGVGTDAQTFTIHVVK